MRNANQTEQLLIGKSLTSTASVNVLDPNNAAYLADGEIVVLDENDTPVGASPTYGATKYIKLVQRSGAVAADAQLVQSARIDGANVISFRGLSYAAPQEQILYAGFDGTSGSIDPLGTADFVTRITFKHDKDMWSQQANTRIFRFTPVITTIERDIADDLARQASADEFLASELIVERLINAADVDDAGITWTFTKGSKTATTSAGTAAVVGDYIKDGDNVTNAAYKITAISGNTVTLDQVFQRASVAVVDPDFVTNAVAILAATNFGIRFEGRPQIFKVLKFPYVKVKFDVTLAGFGATTINRAQESLVGSGTSEQISTIEQFAIGFEGVIDRFGDSAPTGRADAVAGAVYDFITIEFFQNYDTFAVSGARPARALLNIAIVDGSSQGGTIIGQLNTWMSTVPGTFPPVTI